MTSFVSLGLTFSGGKEQFKSTLLLFSYENTNSSGRRNLLSKALKDLKHWMTG